MGVRAGALHAKVIQIHGTIYNLADQGAAAIAGPKGALSCLGLCNDLIAEPFCRLDDAKRRLIQRHLAKLELPSGAPRE